jgi:hypothetical protein
MRLFSNPGHLYMFTYIGKPPGQTEIVQGALQAKHGLFDKQQSKAYQRSHSCQCKAREKTPELYKYSDLA